MIIDYENPPEDHEAAEAFSKRSFRVGIFMIIVLVISHSVFEPNVLIIGVVAYIIYLTMNVLSELKQGTNIFKGVLEYSRLNFLFAWQAIYTNVKKHFTSPQSSRTSEEFDWYNLGGSALFLTIFIYLPFVVLPVFIVSLVKALLVTHSTAVNFGSAHLNFIFFGNEMESNEDSLTILRAITYALVYCSILMLPILLVVILA